MSIISREQFYTNLSEMMRRPHDNDETLSNVDFKNDKSKKWSKMLESNKPMAMDSVHTKNFLMSIEELLNEVEELKNTISEKNHKCNRLNKELSVYKGVVNSFTDSIDEYDEWNDISEEDIKYIHKNLMWKPSGNKIKQIIEGEIQDTIKLSHLLKENLRLHKYYHQDTEIQETLRREEMKKLKDHYDSEIRKECHKTDEYARMSDRNVYFQEQMNEKDEKIKELYEELNSFKRRAHEDFLEQDQMKIMYDREKLSKFKSELRIQIEKELKKDENYATNCKTRDLEKKIKTLEKNYKKLQKKLAESRLENSQLQDSVDSLSD